MKKIILAFIFVLSLFTLVSCNKTTNSIVNSDTSDKGISDQSNSIETNNYNETIIKGDDIVNVELSVKDYGIIELEIYKDIAPITADNFINLVKSGFYDGLTFHRIIKNFMIQGGDPLGNGTGGSDQNIKGEFAANGVQNNLSHRRGVISMARSNYPDSASSQFFIMHKDAEYLDGNYAAFGRVTSGIDVVDDICDEVKPTDGNGTVPKEMQPIIEYIKVID